MRMRGGFRARCGDTTVAAAGHITTDWPLSIGAQRIRVTGAADGGGPTATNLAARSRSRGTSVSPALGCLLVERPVDALESALDGAAGGLVRNYVQAVGQDRVGSQPGQVLNTDSAVLLGQ